MSHSVQRHRRLVAIALRLALGDLARLAVRLLRWLRRLLAGLMAALLLVLVLAVALNWRPLVIGSGSMRPVLQVGDLIVISPVAPTQVRRGQIVTFADPKQPQRTLTHRVVKVVSGGALPPGYLEVTTRGDANARSESWTIRADGKLGLMRARLPGVGRALVALTSPLAKALAALAGGGMLLAGLLYLLWGSRAPRRR